MIQLKDVTILYSLLDVPLHEDLRELISWLSTRRSHIVITCAHEKRDYPSVHDTIPLRGLDIRSRIYPAPQLVVEDINQHWIYDPNRPEIQCAVLHDTGRGMHIHIQVHDNTIHKP